MKEQLGFETASLQVREFTMDDYDALLELTRQPEITDILTDWAMSEEQLSDFLSFVAGSYTSFNPEDVKILLAVVHKQDNRLIGWCGVFDNDKLDPADREIAYAISKDYRNRGYTSEAAKAMTSYIFEHSTLKQIVAIVKPFNVPSRRVVEKTGFKHHSLVRLNDGYEYDYFVISPHDLYIKSVPRDQIEPYMDLIAEIEHVHLDRSIPAHEQWLSNRVRSYYERGAVFYAYSTVGLIAVLHEEAPPGIPALGARAEVLLMGVNQADRRSGIGSALLRHAEEYARGRGAYCLFLMTYAEDYDVIAFYGKNGFIPVGALPDVYGPELAGNVFMRKIVKQ